MVRSAPLQLIRRPASPALAMRPRSQPHRLLSASRFPRSQSTTPPPPPPQTDPHTPPPSGAPADQKAGTAADSNVILRHSIPSYRFIHATILGQVGVAFTLSPMILADEQFVLNPTAPWLAFGLPVWATAQWLLWRWFVRHWVVEIRTLPGPVYEFDTISRAFACTKTRTLRPTDFASRERVTAFTSILRVRNPQGYFLLSACRRCVHPLTRQTGARRRCSSTSTTRWRRCSTRSPTSSSSRPPPRRPPSRPRSAKSVRSALTTRAPVLSRAHRGGAAPRSGGRVSPVQAGAQARRGRGCRRGREAQARCREQGVMQSGSKRGLLT